MLPSEGRQVFKQCVINSLPVVTKRICGAFQIDRVPQHDGGGDQVEATGAIALLLKAAIPDFTQSVKEHGPGQCIAGLAFGVLLRKGT